MAGQLLNERDIEFLLYEFLETEQLLQRPRYREHSREIFDATLDTARTIAEKYFANHYAKGDASEPVFDGEKVQLIGETQRAWDAFAEAGFLAAHYDFDEGGLQLPEIILRASLATISAANIASAAYPFLTLGAANLIHAFADETLKARFLPPMMDGRFAGTMALTEPDQGSALADIRTSAEPAEDGSYRIRGQKMFISGGDQSLTENIVHMVLARIKGAPAGVVKSWPSKYCLKANELAIQVLGGAGYIREHPLEQLYRDNRLNPIHEGTEAIHGLDLLGRKVPADNMAGYRLLRGEINNTIAQARDSETLSPLAAALEQALEKLDNTTNALFGQMQKDIDRGLANATLYLDVFGRVVAAWIWLRQALVADAALANPVSGEDGNFYRGKLQAARFYIEWELPEIDAQTALLNSGNRVPFEMDENWF